MCGACVVFVYKCVAAYVFLSRHVFLCGWLCVLICIFLRVSMCVSVHGRLHFLCFSMRSGIIFCYIFHRFLMVLNLFFVPFWCLDADRASPGPLRGSPWAPRWSQRSLQWRKASSLPPPRPPKMSAFLYHVSIICRLEMHYRTYSYFDTFLDGFEWILGSFWMLSATMFRCFSYPIFAMSLYGFLKLFTHPQH